MYSLSFYKFVFFGTILILHTGNEIGEKDETKAYSWQEVDDFRDRIWVGKFQLVLRLCTNYTNTTIFEEKGKNPFIRT